MGLARWTVAAERQEEEVEAEEEEKEWTELGMEVQQSSGPKDSPALPQSATHQQTSFSTGKK